MRRLRLSVLPFVPFVPFVPALLLTLLVVAVPALSLAQGKLADKLSKPPAANDSRIKMLDQIVAVVNDEVITRVELNERVRGIERQLGRQSTALPPRDVLEHQMLERMIVERAQLQNAKESNIRVDDLQLDRAVARVAEQSGLTVQALRDRVEADGQTFARFREDLRDEIVISRLREREVDSRVQVSEGEIDAFLAGQKGDVGGDQELNLAQILLRVPEGASADQIERQRQRADDLFKQISAGADFDKLSASASDAPEALTGGSLGWRPADRWPQLFVDTVAGLKPGQTAAPVKSANGFHILKLVDRRSAGAQPGATAVQQTRARHILIRVNELTSAAQARQRLTELKQRIESGQVTFEDMARQYSADGSASRGGDLGVLYPGDTVPEFERAMDALKPGQVSDPVESPFGWHLIQVTERKTADMSTDRQRQAVRLTLRERKIDDAYQDWLRQLRDRSYVDIRLDDK